MREQLDELRPLHRGQRRFRAALRRGVHDAVDAAVPLRPLELARQDLIAQVLRDVALVLDDPVVHVDDVQRAVGRRGQIHRPEPLVGRGDELAALVRLLAAQHRAVVGHDDAADQVAGRLGEEHVAVQFRGQPVAAIERRRAHCRERGERLVRPQDAVLITAVHAGSRPDRPHGVEVAGIERLVAAAGPHHARVARVVGCRHDVHEQRRGVRVAVDAAARRPGSRPTGRATASCAHRRRRPSAAAAWFLPTCTSSCRAPTAASSRCARRWPRPARSVLVTSSFVSATRSPLVSRASQRLGGSAISAPRSRTFSVRGSTSLSRKTVFLSIFPSLLVSSRTLMRPVGCSSVVAGMSSM